MSVLKEEEYEWFLKQQQKMRLTMALNYGTIGKKRKNTEISKEIQPSSQKEPIKPSTSTEKPKLKKSKLLDGKIEPKEPIIKFNGFNTPEVQSPNQWLIWRSNSCRLDAFFTIMMFSLVNDESFNLNCLNTESNRRLRETLQEMSDCKNVTSVQKNLELFGYYRQLNNGELFGEICSIVPLFTQLGEVVAFKFSLKDKRNCKCGKKSTNCFDLGPLISITTANLHNSKGNVKDAINSKLKSFWSECFKCKKDIKTVRSIVKYPEFLFILLEVCDENNSLQSRKQFDLFGSIKLHMKAKIGKYNYNLVAICYFQHIHYTVHVSKVTHSKISGLNFHNWCFHDGYGNDGRIIESKPKLKFNMKKDENIPYILLYKQEH